MNDETPLIYFDNNSTTEPFGEVAGNKSANFANASSYHRAGLRSRLAIENAREKVAAFIGARPSEIVFTSCGSEANNMAVAGVINHYKYDAGVGRLCIILSAVEHHSILNITHNPAFRDVEFRIAPVDSNGVIDLAALDEMITPSVSLVSVMMANNETGAVMPFEKIGELCARKSVLFHCDAVCASGKIPYSLSRFACDLLTVSAHKMYGPKGAACLYIRRGVTVAPLIYGGHQENDMRAGTENIHAIEGFGICCDIVRRDFDKIAAHYKELKSAFTAELIKTMPRVKINCAGAETLPNTLSLLFEFADEHQSNAFMFNLDLMGLAVSRGAACASSAVAPSHVLLAMCLDKNSASSAVRVSFGVNNTIAEVLRAVEIMRVAYDTAVNAGRSA